MRCKGRPQKKECAGQAFNTDDVGYGDLNVDNSFNKIRVRGFLRPVGGGGRYTSELPHPGTAATGKPAIARKRDFWAIRVRSEDVFLRIRRQHGQEPPTKGWQSACRNQLRERSPEGSGKYKYTRQKGTPQNEGSGDDNAMPMSHAS